MQVTRRLILTVVCLFALTACGFKVSVGPDFGSDFGPSSDFGGDFGGSGVDSFSLKRPPYFDAYILKAVKRLYSKYKLLGYDVHSLYTHDLPYGSDFLVGTPGPKTMCVAAQVEVLLTAMEIYARETGDYSVYAFLPIQSWKGLKVTDIKGHIWVNSAFDAHGTADALAHFGMGEVTPFEKLRPGAFINFNREKGNGHAVTFLSYIDINGRESAVWNASVVGFKYFSAQGQSEAGSGGFDYRYAVFSKFGCPTTVPDKRDCGIIYSANRTMLNAGRMWSPGFWAHPPRALSETAGSDLGETVFDAERFDGVVGD